MANPAIRVNELKLEMIDSRHGKNTRGWQTMGQKEKTIKRSHTTKEGGASRRSGRNGFFVSTKATCMTGSVAKLDGGYTLGGDKSTEMPPGIL